MDIEPIIDGCILRRGGKAGKGGTIIIAGAVAKHLQG
jgi:hypothetical protein